MASPDEEEDDYMTMAVAEPAPSLPVSSLARKQARLKEAEARARPKSKRELEAAAAAARDAALLNPLDSSNRGAKMMAKLGFKGGSLGKKLDTVDGPDADAARTEPILLNIKEDRGGIGMESERKRKVREQMEASTGREKRRKADEGEFVERVRREREDKRVEGMYWGAMKVAGGLAETEVDQSDGRKSRDTDVKSVNVLWRNLVRERLEKERDLRIRRAYDERFSRPLPEVADREEDADDKIAMGTEVEDEDVEEEDSELDDFNALPSSEKLEKLVSYLRDTYNYCFWCKYRYPDTEMDGCPGTTEEDHD